MKRSFIRSPSHAVTVLLGFVSAGAVAAVVAFPAQSFDASLRGLGLWWNIVFPAMLPYFILYEIMSAYGIHALFSAFLSPVVRWLRLPSAAGQAISASFLAGYPAGIERLSALKDGGILTEREARLVSIAAHAAHPALLIAITAVALLQSPELALAIVLVQQGAWLASVIVMRPLMRGDGTPPARGNSPVPEPGRTFGRVLGDAVAGSLERLMQLGGTIMLLSVVIRLAEELGLLTHAAVVPVVTAAVDPYLGVQALSKTAAWSDPWQFALINSALAWGGLSAHLLTRAALRDRGIGYGPFLAARVMQTAAAGLLGWWTWTMIAMRKPSAISLPADPALAPVHAAPLPEPNLPLALLTTAAVLLSLWVRRRAGRSNH